MHQRSPGHNNAFAPISPPPSRIYPPATWGVAAAGAQTNGTAAGVQAQMAPAFAHSDAALVHHHEASDLNIHPVGQLYCPKTPLPLKTQLYLPVKFVESHDR